MSSKDGDPRAELARLKAKMMAIDDRDIRAVLKARVDELTAQVEAMPIEEETKVVEAPPAPPTPEQAEAAERLIRQAMLEKRRGNTKAAGDLMQQAVDAAPGAPAVLEALGDDLAERRRNKEAIEMYARALKLDPKNVGLETKHARLVLSVGSAGSIEDQLRSGLSDSMFLNQSDAVASLGTARILSFLAPGLGHLVLGRTLAGFALLGTWIGCIVWLFIQKDDVAGLFRFAFGGRGNIGLGIFPPLLIGAITLFAAVGSLGSERRGARAVRAQRPTPPIDLPFE